jgi:hypothetical protein
MSYLGPLRIHFAGRFRATPATVNNDPANYGQIGGKLDEGFNPTGDSGWRLLDCHVSGAFLGTGKEAPDDPVRRYRVADADRRVSAKIVDLDPQQQLVSEIWGLEIRLADRDDRTALRGLVAPAAMSDLWQRDQTAGGDAGLSAAYQSVMGELEWGEVNGSEVLAELRAAALATDQLSIKFNVDRFEMDRRSPDFMTGRIVGTIGAARPGEPRHFVLGRQLVAQPTPGGGPMFKPLNLLNSCPAVVDEDSRRVYIDLGNALPSSGVVDGEPMPRAFRLRSIAAGQDPGTGYTDLGHVPVGGGDWYERTGGIVAVPGPDEDPLGYEQIDHVLGERLELVSRAPRGKRQSGPPTWQVAESLGGDHVRADRFVYRMEPGDVAEVVLYATRFGAALGGASVIVYADPGQLQGPSGEEAPSMESGFPRVAYPPDALDYDRHLTTDADGIARLTMRAGDPGGQRGAIDGQVFGLRPVLEQSLSIDEGRNPGEFVSVLVWDRFEPLDPPTWYGTIEPIFGAYKSLYPVMDAVVDLSSYDDVCANREVLLFAFALPVSDPNSMPVSRDLSPSKRAAIVRWLGDLDEGGRPRVGIGRDRGVVLPEQPTRRPGSRSGSTARPEDGKTAALGLRRAARPSGGDNSARKGAR